MTLTELNRELAAGGTDKSDQAHTFGGRHYLDVYEPLFAKWRDDEFDLVEIGVKDGGSMRLWERYFKCAHIHGLDINPKCAAHAGGRVSVTVGAQSDPYALAAVAKSCPSLRLVIDDGSHLLSDLLASFYALWPRVVSRGLYIMEDTSTSYVDWPTGATKRSVLDTLILETLKNMDNHRGDVLSLACSNNLLIFEKL